MPWCEPCGRFYHPESTGDDGRCPVGHEASSGGDGAASTSTPWHFKLLLVALVGYLGWRLIEGIGWLIG